MKADAPLPPATIAGTPLDRYFHACAFVRERSEEDRVVGPFLAEAIANHERALYIVDDGLRADYAERLTDSGAQDTETHLVLCTWMETYLAEGVFSADKMLAAVEVVMQQAADAGFRRVRIVGQMGWAFTGAPMTDALIEYEVKVNAVLARTKNPAICVYDLAQLDGTMMMDLLRAHPLSIVNGVLYDNPFFTPPEQMLAEIRARGAGVAAATVDGGERRPVT